MKEKFVNAIIEFKKKYNLKLHDIFNRNSDNKEAIVEFFKTPSVLDYLSRDADQIQFDQEGNPVLNSDASSKETKKLSDYYENRIYNLTKDTQVSIPYRSYDKQFYKSGTNSRDIELHIEKIKDEANENDIYVSEIGDIYNIRKLLNNTVHYGKVEFKINQQDYVAKDSNIRYILTNNHKDDHATMMLHILDHDKNTLCSIFINSWLDKSYTKYLEERFNYEGYYNFSCTDEYSKELEIKSSDDKIFDKTLPFYCMKNSKDKWNLFDNIVIPIVDASHHIQTAEEDGNCVIYALNFTEAISQMLKDKTKADEIHNLAQQVATGDNNAKDKIKHIFQEELKQYLPMYYNENNQSKSHEELKEYHLRKRWNIGSEKLQIEYGR